MGRLQPCYGNAASIGRDYSRSISTWYSCRFGHRPIDTLTQASHLAWRLHRSLRKPLVNMHKRSAESKRSDQRFFLFETLPAYRSTKNNTISIENIIAARIAI